MKFKLSKNDIIFWFVFIVMSLVILLCMIREAKANDYETNIISNSITSIDSSLALKVLRVARREINQREFGANNRGSAVQKYLKGKEALPWCAGFVSYCLQKSGAKFNYTLRAKDFLTYGIKVIHVLPGDLAVFTRKGGGHIGIVEQVFKDYYISIEGNVGSYPAKVKRIKHFYNEKSFLGFRRL